MLSVATDRRVMQMLSKSGLVQAGGLAAIFGVAPSVGGAGDIPVNVQILGANFGAGSIVAVSGAGITISNVVIVTPALITAIFTIDVAAAQTTRNVTVTSGGAVAGPAPFTVTAPVNLTGTALQLWLDATRPQDLTIATGVSSWKDATGNGRALTQATPGFQPAVIAVVGDMNSLPAVRFDGVDDALAMAWPAGGQLNLGSTIFAVAAVRFNNDATYRPLIRFTPSNAATLQHESTLDAVVPSRSRLETFIATNTGTKRATPALATAQGPRVLTMRVAPGEPSINLYKNGVLNGGPTAGFASLTSSIGDTLGLGIDDAANHGQYDVGEVVVLNTPLTVAQQQAWEAYLVRKWINAPTTGRGPILLQSSVIDGVTISIDYYVAGGANGGDMHGAYQSAGLFPSWLVFHFSSPVIQFAITQAYSPYPGDIGQASLVMGGGPPAAPNGILSPINASAAFTNTSGNRQVITYAPGFSTVLVGTYGRRSDSGYNIASYSNARFWLVGDPL